MVRDRDAGALVVEDELLRARHRHELRCALARALALEQVGRWRRDDVPDRGTTSAPIICGVCQAIEGPRLGERHRLLLVEPRTGDDVVDARERALAPRMLDATARVFTEPRDEAEAEAELPDPSTEEKAP